MIGHTKRVLVWGVCTYMMAASLGCVVPGTNTGVGDVPPAVTKFQSGIEAVDAAKRDLAALLSGRKNPVGIKYYGLPGINDLARQGELVKLLEGRNRWVGMYYGPPPQSELMYVYFTSLSVLEDRIEVSPRVYFSFSDLIESPVTVAKSRDGGAYPYMIHFEGLMSFHFDVSDFADAQRFTDDLRVIQRHLKKPHDERFAQFESKAAEYRALKVKTPVSEEKRKFIVQANALSQKKEYGKAIEMYLKAVELDPVSYPGAYFNLALLSAQVNRFNSAITYMKQYLLLEPEAKDARSAQDKIYEWELILGK